MFRYGFGWDGESTFYLLLTGSASLTRYGGMGSPIPYLESQAFFFTCTLASTSKSLFDAIFIPSLRQGLFPFSLILFSCAKAYRSLLSQM